MNGGDGGGEGDEDYLCIFVVVDFAVAEAR